MKHLLFLFLTITIFSASGQSLQNDLKAYDSLECRMPAEDLERLFDTLKDIVYLPDMPADSLIPITTYMFNIAGCLHEPMYSAEAWEAFAHVYNNSILIMVYPKGYQSSLRNALYYYKVANSYKNAADLSMRISYANADNCGVNIRWAKKAIRLYDKALKKEGIDSNKVLMAKAKAMLALGQRYNSHEKYRKAVNLWEEALKELNVFNDIAAIKLKLQLLAELTLLHDQFEEEEMRELYKKYKKEMNNLQQKLSEMLLDKS